ncbi:heterokaryon incompatibility protein-domain-containing protein [Xylariaceae sp. FL0662B]|nr:heterokaryon incompatibility protein-domain-containing protein [Xylariaceae sp. FL0662B]
MYLDRYAGAGGKTWTALSYRWADEDDVAPGRIREMDNTTTAKTPGGDTDYGLAELSRSALTMLLALYQSGWIKDKRVWINHVCINQQNPDEKGVRVALMGDVYMLLSRILVYTGQELPSTELAMKFWRTLDSTFNKLPRLNSQGDLCYVSFEALLEELNMLQSSLEWAALREMLTVPRFGRLWVIQEAVFPTDVVFIWGLDSKVWTSVSGLERIGLLRENREDTARG